MREVWSLGRSPGLGSRSAFCGPLGEAEAVHAARSGVREGGG